MTISTRGKNKVYPFQALRCTSHELDYSTEPNDDEHKHRFIQVLSKDGGNTIDRLIITIVPRSTEQKFNAWYSAEKASMAWLAELQPLFSTIETTIGFDGFLPHPDRNFNPFIYQTPHKFESDAANFYHPGAIYEIRGRATPGGHAHQATYNSSGVLITTGVSAGSADKQAAFPAQIDGTLHRDADVKPFVWALQLDGNPAQGAGTPNYIELSAPMLHEGVYIKKYLEVRPPIANGKPRLAPGATP